MQADPFHDFAVFQDEIVAALQHGGVTDPDRADLRELRAVFRQLLQGALGTSPESLPENEPRTLDA